MPLDRLVLPAPGVRVCFWKITETPDTLLQMYQTDAEEETRILSLPPPRQQHYLASRLLVKTLHPDHSIDKDSFGKPFLPGFNGGISWSHSGNYAALISNEHSPTGIDIETLSPRILKIEDKFCNKNDKACIHRTHYAQSLLIIWGAKESMYKWYGKKEMDFRLHMTCDPFDLHEEGRFSAHIHMNDLHHDFLLEYLVFDGHLAVWMVEDGSE